MAPKKKPLTEKQSKSPHKEDKKLFVNQQRSIEKISRLSHKQLVGIAEDKNDKARYGPRKANKGLNIPPEHTVLTRD